MTPTGDRTPRGCSGASRPCEGGEGGRPAEPGDCAAGTEGRGGWPEVSPGPGASEGSRESGDGREGEKKPCWRPSGHALSVFFYVETRFLTGKWSVRRPREPWSGEAEEPLLRPRSTRSLRGGTWGCRSGPRTCPRKHTPGPDLAGQPPGHPPGDVRSVGVGEKGRREAPLEDRHAWQDVVSWPRAARPPRPAPVPPTESPCAPTKARLPGGSSPVDLLEARPSCQLPAT